MKELVHEEATHLANQLRARAAEGRAHALELARRVADVQAKTRATTRSLEATTAELAMVRAAAYALEDERDRLEDANAEARENLERGDAPDDDADAEWARRARWDDAREGGAASARRGGGRRGVGGVLGGGAEAERVHSDGRDVDGGPEAVRRKRAVQTQRPGGEHETLPPARTEGGGRRVGRRRGVYTYDAMRFEA